MSLYELKWRSWVARVDPASSGNHVAHDQFAALQLDTVPPGTLNYIGSRQHTPSEAIDLVNRVLLIKGYTLVRHDRLLSVINLEVEAIGIVASHSGHGATRPRQVRVDEVHI